MARLHHWVVALTIIAAAGLTACIIGPKQDDPEASTLSGAPDASANADSGEFPGADTATPTIDAGTKTDDVGAPPADDASPDASGDADASADGASDAPSDTRLDDSAVEGG